MKDLTQYIEADEPINKLIAVKFRPSTLTRIDQHAQELGITRSQLLRAAVLAYLDS